MTNRVICVMLGQNGAFVVCHDKRGDGIHYVLLTSRFVMKHKFKTAFGVIASYKAYDYYQFTQISDELRKQVEPLKLQTVHHLDKVPYSLLMVDNPLFFTTFIKDGKQITRIVR